MAQKEFTTDVQNRATHHVASLKYRYKKQLKNYHNRAKRINKAVMSFTGTKQAKWKSSLKMNFANQIENLITARLTARNPRFIVSFRVSPEDIAKDYFKGDPSKNIEEFEEFKKDVYLWAKSIQEYLNFAFEEYDYNKTVRLLNKSLIRYGNAYGEACYKVKKIYKKRNGEVIEAGVKKYPYLDQISFTELYFDPRYQNIENSPAVIRCHEKVRLSELYMMKEDLMNLDKIKKVQNSDSSNMQKDGLYSLEFINQNGETQEKTYKTLTVDKFQGYFSLDKENEEKEMLYEIWTVNDTIVIKLEPIAEISIKNAGCFEDPEQGLGVGYIEPMLDAMDEYNFKLNSQNQFINQSLNRSYFWDPNSGIDPRQLAKASSPGAIIPVSNGMRNAMDGLQEIEYRSIPTEYFSSQNEIRRDIQALTFTIDTTAPNSQQGFTNTATAVRARFYESNTVYADTLKHLEELLVKLAYSLIDQIPQMADEGENVIIGRLGKNKFKWAKPEIFDNALLRYSIKVEVGSSSFDTVESRREEALALWTIAKEAKATGYNIDGERVLEDILGTFEKRSPQDYIKKEMGEDIMGLLGQAAQGNQLPSPRTSQSEREALTAVKPSLQNPEELTQAVSGGKL